MDTTTSPDGITLYVNPNEHFRGTKGGFDVVYKTEEFQEPWGYRCSNCGTLNNAMDTLGRVVCNDCGNTKSADEWDAAHE